MTSWTIDAGGVHTAIMVDQGLLARAGEMLRQVHEVSAPVLLVSDDRVAATYLARVKESLVTTGFRPLEFIIAPGEVSKSVATAENIYQFLAHHRFPREGMIIALGGGVVSDLAGFVAATWMRGVHLAICPTTMEAQVDAAIGGKTAINIPGGKNLVGAFHFPVLVLVDPSCLLTLSKRDRRAGLAESIKHALVFSDEFFAWHERHVEEIASLHEPTMLGLVERNLRIKGDVVARDPHDRSGARMLLNFGHTIGHAIEEYSQYALRHGECVALGMLAACRLSQSLGILDDLVIRRLISLLAALDLPTNISEPMDIDRILATIGLDKKVRAGKVRFVLLKAIGQPSIRDDIPEREIREACESLLSPSAAG